MNAEVGLCSSFIGNLFHLFQEACQIPGIGKRMADKIDEIMESGHLRKLDHIGEAVPVLELFNNIWGAGAKTAQLWYQQVTNTHMLTQQFTDMLSVHEFGNLICRIQTTCKFV